MGIVSEYRCPLGKLQPVPTDVEKIKREGWLEQGILVVSVNDPRLVFYDREAITQIGNRFYGERKT